jgi:hypothetical protein
MDYDTVLINSSGCTTGQNLSRTSSEMVVLELYEFSTALANWHKRNDTSYYSTLLAHVTFVYAANKFFAIFSIVYKCANCNILFLI